MTSTELHQPLAVAPYMGELADVLPPDSLVLDMGSWEGRNGNYLAQEGHRVVSVDIDPGATERGAKIARAVGNGTLQNSFVRGDMLHPMFRDQTFDAVISTVALQDVVPKQKAIEALFKIMDLTKPGGLNLTRVYIGTAEQRVAKARNYSVFAPSEIQSIYAEQEWEFVKPPFQTPRPHILRADGSISSVAHVLVRRPGDK